MILAEMLGRRPSRDRARWSARRRTRQAVVEDVARAVLGEDADGDGRAGDLARCADDVDRGGLEDGDVARPEDLRPVPHDVDRRGTDERQGRETGGSRRTDRERSLAMSSVLQVGPSLDGRSRRSGRIEGPAMRATQSTTAVSRDCRLAVMDRLGAMAVPVGGSRAWSHAGWPSAMTSIGETPGSGREAMGYAVRFRPPPAASAAARWPGRASRPACRSRSGRSRGPGPCRGRSSSRGRWRRRCRGPGGGRTRRRRSAPKAVMPAMT